MAAPIAINTEEGDLIPSICLKTDTNLFAANLAVLIIPGIKVSLKPVIIYPDIFLNSSLAELAKSLN